MVLPVLDTRNAESWYLQPSRALRRLGCWRRRFGDGVKAPPLRNRLLGGGVALR